MPALLGITVIVVQILCSTVRLAGKPAGVEADQGSEAVDPENKQEHYDDVHPPHVHHYLSVALRACPVAEAETVKLDTLVRRQAG
jgi:hypothetical protein